MVLYAGCLRDLWLSVLKMHHISISLAHTWLCYMWYIPIYYLTKITVIYINFSCLIGDRFQKWTTCPPWLGYWVDLWCLIIFLIFLFLAYLIYFLRYFFFPRSGSWKFLTLIWKFQPKIILVPGQDMAYFNCYNTDNFWNKRFEITQCRNEGCLHLLMAWWSCT